MERDHDVQRTADPDIADAGYADDISAGQPYRALRATVGVCGDAQDLKFSGARISSWDFAALLTMALVSKKRAFPRLTARKAATIEHTIQSAVSKIIAIKNRPFSKSTVLSSIHNLSLPQIVFTVDSQNDPPECDAISLLERLLEMGDGKESFESGKSL